MPNYIQQHGSIVTVQSTGLSGLEIYKPFKTFSAFYYTLKK